MVPWVLFASIMLMYLFVYMRTQFQVYQAMLYASDEICPYGTVLTYVRGSVTGAEEYDGAGNDLISEIREKAVMFAADGVSGAFIEERAKAYFEDCVTELDCVEGGIDGISFSSSGAFASSGEMTVSASYTFVFPMDFFGVARRDISQRIKVTTFAGSDWSLTDEFDSTGTNDGASEAVAYVAENGTVYHLDRNCVFITTRFREVNFEGVEYLRNRSGGKYYACERCDDTPAGTTVYISDYGEVYHTREDCPAMNRTVNEVPVSEAAESYGPCSRCGGDQ